LTELGRYSTPHYLDLPVLAAVVDAQW